MNIRQKIGKHLNTRPHTVRELNTKMNIRRSTLQTQLWYMVKLGEAKHPERGVYMKPQDEAAYMFGRTHSEV
jgi:hypothetical protein